MGRHVDLRCAEDVTLTDECHHQLACLADGSKLAKSAHAVPLDAAAATRWLWRGLHLLRQQPPADLQSASVLRVWEWALQNWRPEALQGAHELLLSEA